MTDLIPCGRSLTRTDHWIFRQDWKKVIFLHWPLQAAAIRPLLHRQLSPDLYEGSAWLSVVAFTARCSMLRMPFRTFIPILPDFEELNIRTYVTYKGMKGVHFIDIKANKLLPVLLNSALGLPYMRAGTSNDPGHLYCRSGNLHLDIKYTTAPITKEPLDVWLTERYYTFQFNNKKIFEFPICHNEWPLDRADIFDAAIDFTVGPIRIGSPPFSAHYSRQGAEALFWPRKTHMPGEQDGEY